MKNIGLVSHGEVGTYVSLFDIAILLWPYLFQLVDCKQQLAYSNIVQAVWISLFDCNSLYMDCYNLSEKLLASAYFSMRF